MKICRSVLTISKVYNKWARATYHPPPPLTYDIKTIRKLAMNIKTQSPNVGLESTTLDLDSYDLPTKLTRLVLH